MLRIKLSLACLLVIAGACGGGGDDTQYPPLPPFTSNPDAGGPGTPDGGGPPDPIAPIINEIVYEDTSTGTEVGNYIEIIGEPNTDYSDLTLLSIEGDNGGSQGRVQELVAIGITDADGRFASTVGLVDLENPTNTFLLVRGYTGNATPDEVEDDIDTDDDGVVDVEPWTAVLDAVATDDGGASDHVYTTIGGVTYGPTISTSTGAAGGLSLIPDGTQDAETADWLFIDIDPVDTVDNTRALPTPGAENVTGPSA